MIEPNTYYSATFVYDDASVESLIEYKLGLWSTVELAMKAIEVFKHSEQGDKVRLRVRIPNSSYDKGFKRHTYAKYIISEIVVDKSTGGTILHREDDERFSQWLDR